MKNTQPAPIPKRRIPLVCVGAVLILAGLATLIGFGTMLHITCTRSDAVTTCQTRISFMGFIPLSRDTTLHDVRHADVAESCSDNGEIVLCSYGVDITTGGGIHRLNGHFFSGPTAIEIVKNINLLKEAPADGLVLRKNIQNRSLLGLGWICVVGPLLILGILFLLTYYQNRQPR